MEFGGVGFLILTGIWIPAQAVQSLYSLTADQLFSSSTAVVIVRHTDAEQAATEQASAGIRPQAVLEDSVPDTSISTSDESSSELRSSQEFEDMADAWMADPKNADTYDAWFREEEALASVGANAAPVPHPMIPPKVDTVRAPLSPTAANRTRWPSAAKCPGAARPPEQRRLSQATATAPVAAAETAPAAAAEHTPSLQAAQQSGGSNRNSGDGSGGRPGQKRGHAVTEQPGTKGDTVGDGRKRCALSKNQAQVSQSFHYTVQPPRTDKLSGPDCPN